VGYLFLAIKIKCGINYQAATYLTTPARFKAPKTTLVMKAWIIMLLKRLIVGILYSCALLSPISPVILLLGIKFK